MKKNKKVETRGNRRRIQHEAEGGASGALAGALVGASAGPPGAITGAILGGLAGALAAAVMDRDASAREQRIRDLDGDPCFRGDGLQAQERHPRPPAIRAYSPTVSDVPAENPPAGGVSFRVRSLFRHVSGRFSTWRGSLAFDERTPENSRLEVEIDAASIDTQEPLRDAYLRSAGFFDVRRYPKLVFNSTKIERAGDKFKLTGDLTMLGITKPVTLDVEYADREKHTQIGERADFIAHGSINRKDWGLTWNEILDGGGAAASDNVEIFLGIEATRAS